jgi:hypothetical protein
MHERSYRFSFPYKMLSGRPYPVLAVTFTYQQTTKSFLGLVDSGAERSLCSGDIAEEAGVDLALFPRIRIKGVGGLERARRCPIDLTILGRRVATEVFVVERKNFVLLGRHDVFNAFQIGFDERAKELLVEPY